MKALIILAGLLAAGVSAPALAAQPSEAGVQQMAALPPLYEAELERAQDFVAGMMEQGIVVRQVGTPLTHQRFLRRHRGNYGLAIAAGNEAGLKFPEVTTPLPGLYRCGDSTTSGIGVPAVASSGAQCANALLSVWEQWKMNDKIRCGSSA